MPIIYSNKEYTLHSQYPIPNTFGIDAKANYYAEYKSEKGLCELLQLYHQEYKDLPLLHIGDGSNLLFLSDYSGLILQSQIHSIKIVADSVNEIFIRVGGGVNFDAFIAYAISQEWYGLENLSLIPGQVGASAVQNIGAYGVEAKDFIHQVEGISLVDGSSKQWSSSECQYAYRQSIFKNHLKGEYAITYVTFRLERKFSPKLAYGGLLQAITQSGYNVENLTAEQLRKVIINVRRQKLPDPNELGSAGSFFMNPIVPRSIVETLSALYPQMPYYEVDENYVKVPAGWLIEQSGWKGRSVGRAAVYQKQALVLVNTGRATAIDILKLSNAICSDVQQKFGITLQPEVNFIGTFEMGQPKSEEP